MNLQNLLFQVSLLDRVSGPARGIMSTMDSVSTRIQSGLSKIGYGAAGITGAFLSLESIVDASDQIDRALAEVSSLDVASDVLDQLNKTALKFSVQYGEDAATFVKSSYDIKSAISSLTSNELPAFTNASGILAKGTKADIGTITGYVGTMYNIFQQNAEAMGKAKWVDQLAGQTAAAVQMFKTTGQGMADAFKTVGAAGQANGIIMSEQIAILGTLQGTMSGSEAGTKYRAFLNSVGRAQDELGLKFTDSQGRMLPMINILEKIRGKFGAIDTVAKADMLKTAFGTDEAVALVKLLSSNIDGLSTSIAQVGEQTGIQKAIDMANAMVDPGDRAARSLEALRIVLAQKIGPTLDMIYDKFTDNATLLMRWTELFPNLTNAVAMGSVSIIGLIGGLSALSVVVGVGKFLAVGFGLTWSALKLVLLPFSPIITALRMGWVMTFIQMRAGMGIMAAMRIGLMSMASQLWINITSLKIFRFVVWLTKGVAIAASFGLNVLGVAFGWLKTAVLTAIPTLWGFATALLANPITWIVLGIGALIGLVAAAVIYWDTWTQAVINWSSAWLQSTGVSEWVGSAIAWFEKIPQWWTQFKGWIATLSPFALAAVGIDFITGKLDAIKQWWTGFKAWLGSLNPFAGIGSGISSLLGMVNKIPGLNIKLGSIAQPAIAAAPKPIAAPAAISQSQTASTPRGGLMSQITNANTSKSVSVGGITVHNYGNKPVNGQRLADELAMVAG